MSSNITAQYQNRNSLIVLNNENVLFDIFLLENPNIIYNLLTGEFQINEVGTYYISWWVSTETTSSRRTSFSVTSSSAVVIGSSPNTKNQLSGDAIINISTAGDTFSLVNTSGDAVRYAINPTIKANITIFKMGQGPGTLFNLLDGNNLGSLYGINSSPGYTMGTNAVSLGDSTTASGETSHAEGSSSVASGREGAHAEGIRTTSSALGSHSEGFETQATGDYSHAEGQACIASARASHAQGNSTTADSADSFAAGRSTRTDGVDGAFVIGIYGGPDNSANGTPATKEYGFFLANGTTFNNRSLSAMILNNGQAYATAWNTGGADYGEMFESSNGQEIKPGYFVTFDNNEKIRKANSNDKVILGITSKTAGVVGNNNVFNWEGKYLKDEWGAYILDENSHRILSSDYYDTKKFASREERPEWVVVGLLGQILVRDDGSSVVGGYCGAGDGGVATSSEYGYPVLKRLSENQILIMFNSITNFNKISKDQVIHENEYNKLNEQLKLQATQIEELEAKFNELLDIVKNK